MKVCRAAACRPNTDTRLPVVGRRFRYLSEYQSFGFPDECLHESPEAPVEVEPDDRVESEPDLDPLIPGTFQALAMDGLQQRGAPNQVVDSLALGRSGRQ